MTELPIAEDKQPACGECRYWEMTVPATEHTVSFGECRRLSPLIIMGMAPAALRAFTSVRGADPLQAELDEHAARAVWPVTLDYDWCGEFQPLVSTTSPWPEWSEFCKPLSVRVCNAFEKHELDVAITSVESLCQLCAGQLLDRQHFGRSCLDEVRRRLAEFDLKLRND